MTATTGTLCPVCSEPAHGPDSALCGVCDRAFHLNQRNDAKAKDCGQVWIDEQFLALRFACFSCLGDGGGDAQAEPPVGEGH